MSLSQNKESISRRQFLKTGALAAIAALLNAAWRAFFVRAEGQKSAYDPQAAGKGSQSNWYVDSQNGDDTNDGHSSSTPLQTLSELQRRGLKSGDHIYLRRGSHWREQLTIPSGADNVLVAAYGGGDLPLLDCSDIQDNGSFSSTEGYNNVYQKAVEVAYLPYEPAWMSVWEDDIRLVRAASLDECNNTPGSYYASNDFSPTCTIYIHASDSSAVNQNGRRYECSVRHAGVYGYFANRTTLQGLRCRRNFCEGGSIKVGQFAILRDCIAEEGNKHNAYIRKGSNVYGCQFTRAYYTQAATMLVLNDDYPSDEDTTIENCLFEIDPASPNADNIAPANGHNNISGYFGTITMSDCVFKNFRTAGMLIYFNHAADIVLNNPRFEECKYGPGAPYVGGAKPGCRMMINGGSWRSSVENQRALNVTVPMIPIVLNNFLFLPGANTDLGYIFINTATQVVLTGCTLDTSAATGISNGIYLVHPDAALTISGMRFRGNLSTWFWMFIANAPSWDSDYNTYEAAFRTHIDGVEYTSLADHQAGTGEDLNSVFVQ